MFIDLTEVIHLQVSLCHFDISYSVCWLHRPMSQAGRPLSGFVRPGTQSARPGTMEQAIRTARTAQTARPVTSASGRYVRLGTVSHLYHRRRTVIWQMNVHYALRRHDRLCHEDSH